MVQQQARNEYHDDRGEYIIASSKDSNGSISSLNRDGDDESNADGISATRNDGHIGEEEEQQEEFSEPEPEGRPDIGLRRPQVFKSTLQEIVTIMCCTMAIAAATITTGYSMLCLDKVSEDFDVIGGALTWSTGAISLGYGSFLLIMGGVSDAFGRKKTVLFSFAFFIAMNLICGFMKNFTLLCIFRALLGAFISAATPSAAGILGSAYKPGKRKNRALATFSAGAPIGFIGGLLVGGIAAQCISWRAGHWFLAILYAFLLPLCYYAIPNDPPLKRSQSIAILKELDYIGAFISLAGFTLFCFAMTQVDTTEKGWKTPYILATFIIGVVLIILLGFYEAYIPKRPILPMQLWKNRNFTLCMMIMALCWIDFQGCLVFYSVLYFEEIKNYSSLHTAVCVLPMGVAGIIVNIIAAMTLHIIPGTYLMITGCIAFAAAAIIWEFMEINRSYWLGPFWAYILCVVGADLSYNVANLVTLSAVDHSLQSSAAGVFNTVIQLAGTVGLGISSVVVSARYDLYGTAEETQYPKKLFDGFRNAYWLAFGCALLALLLCSLLRVGVSHTSDDKKEDSSEKNNDEKN